MTEPMAPERLKDIKANEWTYCRSCGPIIMDCITEIERLQRVLGLVTTKHYLLKNLSTYGPCKCKGSVLCMKHAADDILKMINAALEQ